jgi:hypothetical protein
MPPSHGMWWSGEKAKVAPGAPCRCLPLPQGHELLLRLGRASARPLSRTQVQPRCQDRGRGPGMWCKASRRRWFPGPHADACCCRRGMNCCASVAHSCDLVARMGEGGLGSIVAWATSAVVKYGTSRTIPLVITRGDPSSTSLGKLYHSPLSMDGQSLIGWGTG